MEPLVRIKILCNLFLLVDLYMDPLVNMNTQTFSFYWEHSSLLTRICCICTNSILVMLQ